MLFINTAVELNRFLADFVRINAFSMSTNSNLITKPQVLSGHYNCKFLPVAVEGYSQGFR